MLPRGRLYSHSLTLAAMVLLIVHLRCIPLEVQLSMTCRAYWHNSATLRSMNAAPLSHCATGPRHLYLRQLLGFLLLNALALLGFLLLGSLTLLFNLCLCSQPPLLGLFPGGFLGCFLVPPFPLLLFLLLLFLQSQSSRLRPAVAIIKFLLLCPFLWLASPEVYSSFPTPDIELYWCYCNVMRLRCAALRCAARL